MLISVEHEKGFIISRPWLISVFSCHIIYFAVYFMHQFECMIS